MAQTVGHHLGDPLVAAGGKAAAPAGHGIGFGNSISSNATRTYSKPIYSENKVEKRTAGNKPIIALVAIILMSVLSLGGYSVSKMKAQIDQDAYEEEIINEAVDNVFAEETATETNEYQTPEEVNTNNNYLNENYTAEEPDYTYDEYETNDSTYTNGDYGDSYEQNYENEYDDSDDYGYSEDNYDSGEDEDSSYYEQPSVENY